MIALLAESLEFYYDLNAREGAQRRYVKCSVHGATRGRAYQFRSRGGVAKISCKSSRQDGSSLFAWRNVHAMCTER